MRSRHAPVAQLDRASDYESEGRTFESFRARHLSPENQMVIHPHRGAEARPEFGGSMAEAAQPE